MPKQLRKRNQVLKGSHGGMKVVLLEDVPHVGKQGEVVEVRLGFGRNYLIPNSLAVVPTAHNLRLLERYKIRVQQAREARIADLKVLAEQIHRTCGADDKPLLIYANANEDGILYGSVGGPEISKALRSKNLQVDPEMVEILEPFKKADGTIWEVPLHLGYDIRTTIKLLILPAAS